jgi:hypothetical protein
MLPDPRSYWSGRYAEFEMLAKRWRSNQRQERDTKRGTVELGFGRREMLFRYRRPNSETREVNGKSWPEAEIEYLHKASEYVQQPALNHSSMFIQRSLDMFEHDVFLGRQRSENSREGSWRRGQRIRRSASWCQVTREPVRGETQPCSTTPGCWFPSSYLHLAIGSLLKWPASSGGHEAVRSFA